MNPQTGLELIQLLDRINLDQSAALFATLPLYEQQQFCQILWKRSEIQSRNEQKAIASKAKVGVNNNQKDVSNMKKTRTQKRAEIETKGQVNLF